MGLLALALPISILFPFTPTAQAAASLCKVQTTANYSSCQISCAVNSCERYFPGQDFSCAKFCQGESLAAVTAESVYKCAKGATWDVAKETVMGPINIWEALVASAKKSGEFQDFCDSNIECKRQLAREAALLNPDGSLLPDETLNEISTSDLIHKRANVRSLAERDQDYQAQLRKLNVPLPNLDGTEAPVDAIYAYGRKMLADMGIQWECYGAADRTELICEVISSIVLPGLAVKYGGRLLGKAKDIVARRALVRQLQSDRKLWQGVSTLPDPEAKTFQYTVHSVMDSSAKKSFVETVSSKAGMATDSYIDVLQSPEKISERPVISASLISEKHPGTFHEAGYILDIPPDNIYASSARDLGSSHFSKPLSGIAEAREYLTQQYKTTGLPSPDAIMQGKFHNELLVEGESRAGAKVKVVGVFMKVDPAGNPLSTADVSNTLLQNAQKLKVPVVKIVDYGNLVPDAPMSVNPVSSGAYQVLWDHDGVRHVMMIRPNPGGSGWTGAYSAFKGKYRYLLSEEKVKLQQALKDFATKNPQMAPMLSNTDF